MIGGSRLLAQWWRSSSEYHHAVRYLRQVGLRRVMELLIGAGSFSYGSTALLSAVYFLRVDNSAFSVIVALVVALTSVVIGVLWFRGAEVSERASTAFLFYSDVAVIAIVFCFESSFLAWPGLALLAANGIYAVFHHGAPTVSLHLLISTVAMLWCAVNSFVEGADPLLVVLRGLVLFPIVTMVPLTVLPGVRALNTDAIGAQFDSLTGLLNRRGLSFRATAFVRTSEAVAVLVIDVDKFKSVNDRFGHQRGDEVLIGIGDALRSAVPHDAVTARIGGEEFAILLLGDPAAAAARVHECLSAGVLELSVSVSIGTASTSAFDSPRALAELLDRADTAMYRAKSAGGCRTVAG